MRTTGQVDVVVVGSGPNGMAAAVTMARAGLSVQVIEGADTIGGGCRTEALTLPGYRHDVCSAAHPLLLLSPFFRDSAFDGLRRRLVHPEVVFAHPLEGGRAAVVTRMITETAGGLGRDASAYRRLLGPLVGDAQVIAGSALAPLRTVPRHPAALARFAGSGVRSARHLAGRFETEETRALLAGVSAHSMARLDAPLTGAFGLLLTVAAHAVGWPVVAGGSVGIADALGAELQRLGGTVSTGQWIDSLGQLPSARVVLLDVSPRQWLRMAGDDLAPGYRRALGRFRYGPGVCKVDWALAGPVPWANDACRKAGTLHVGGTFAEVAASEGDAVGGRHPDHPFCLVVQPSVADPSRAPAGHHALWAYCHVPSGSTVDMTTRIEAQIERFAPGFGDLILARSVRTAAEEEEHNPNYVGGDIGGGAASLRQTVFRPTARWNPYRTPREGVYLCSASTPPGGGVHGMCGVYAARTALHDRFGGAPPFRT